jgi:hypothetical protein
MIKKIISENIKYYYRSKIMTWNKKHLKEFRKLDYELRSSYNINQKFKKIYEATHKKNKIENKILTDENVVVLTINGNKGKYLDNENLEILDYINKEHKFDKNIFDTENSVVTISDFFDLMETIRCMITVLEFDLTSDWTDNILNKANVKL